jgi:hypothetical protein
MTVDSGPGNDFASAAQANAASDHCRVYLDYLEKNAKYCTDQAQLFQNALDDYLGIEHRNVAEINKPHQQGPRAGI